MPPSVVKWYKIWINQFPDSWHPSDLERFYMFVSVLLNNNKKNRSYVWLKENLKEDCRKLSDQNIEKYCDIYEHIKNFKNVWKSQQAKLIAQEEINSKI